MTRARVQLDDEDFPAWFNVCQDLRQECMLSPLLFNILFVAVFRVILQRFAADPVIVLDLVYDDGLRDTCVANWTLNFTLSYVERRVPKSFHKKLASSLFKLVQLTVLDLRPHEQSQNKLVRQERHLSALRNIAGSGISPRHWPPTVLVRSSSFALELLQYYG